MRLLLSGVIALVALCRLAAAGEGVTLPNADPMLFTLVRLFGDFGMAGAFIAYLIWRGKKDGEARVEEAEKERQKREEVDQRWHKLDGKLVDLVDKCARIIAECTGVMTEIRQSLRDHDRKISDVVKQSPTRRIPRHETDTE